ncbi:hypothetical protein ACFE04_015805 [Oxalis oulophora]
MMCSMVRLTRKKKAGSVPVYLNVYDLTTFNGYAYWLGLGIYHSGVQDKVFDIYAVHGVEYAFGAHDHSTTGVFEVEPKQCPGFTFRKSILIGRTDLGPSEVHGFMEKLAQEYSGSSYHLITKNCNHFCNDACVKLIGKPIPRWVNRLARLGVICNCVLPAGLNETKLSQVKSQDKLQDAAEKMKLRSRSSRFPSSSSQLPPPPCLTSSASRNSKQRHRLQRSTSLIHSH